MSDLTNVFTDIADAIRAKTETQITYKPTEMADAINNIETGGGVFEITTGKVSSSFNMPVTIAEGVTNMSSCFSECVGFNQPITIPNGVISTALMFYNCRNFNYPITIPDGVTNLQQMFCNCSNLNQPITIPNSAISIASMFYNCRNFNYPITIPDGVTSMFSCFSGCTRFNQPVNIPNGVTNVYKIFMTCNNFNQPVTIPNSLTNLQQMFYECCNFNQPVTIPNSVTTIFYMFANCNNFNQPIIIPNSVVDVDRAFMHCYNFNQLLIIPSSVKRLEGTFLNCYNFNQPVIIPNNIINAQSMFYNCTGFGSNIYWYTNIQKTATKNMFYNCNNSLAKHIFTNNTNAFNGTATTNSITGTAITWTQEGNNYYNTAYNIYIHNVANPYTILNNASYSDGDINLTTLNTFAIVFGNNVSSVQGAFRGVTDLRMADTVVFLGDHTEIMSSCFMGCDYLNQPVTIPASVSSADGAIAYCANFNCPVVIQNSNHKIDISMLLQYSASFDSDVWLPESVTLGDPSYWTDVFKGCTAFASGSGIVHISHNITLGDTNNPLYNSLVNGHIGITLDPSRILNDY